MEPLTVEAALTLDMNYGHDKAQAHHPISQTDGNQNGSHVPGPHYRGSSGVPCQCSACSQTWLFSPADGRTQNMSFWSSWGRASLVLTRPLGSCPWSQACGSACLSQVRNTDCLLQPGFLMQENPAGGSCTNTAWF